MARPRISTPGDARTVYATLSRGRSSADVLKLYDVPPPMQHIPMRYLTITPLQALFVMNSGFVQEQAADAGRTRGQPEPRPRTKSRRSIGRCLRATRPQDEARARREVSQPAPTRARYAQALLSTNEVIFWP